MKILFVYKEDYPWDVRVEKIADSLLADGHRVSMVARNEANRPSRASIGELHLHRLPRSPQPLRALLNVPAFLNPAWVLTLASAFRRAKPDVVIVRDIPLVPAVLPLARLHRSRVVLDMAECYPELYATLVELSDHPRLLALGKNPKSAQRLESLSVKRCDHTFTVVEETRERLVARGHDPERITVVSNTPRDVGTLSVHRHRADPVLRLGYIGFVERVRGLDLVLQGLDAFTQVRPDLEFSLDVIGTGPARAELEGLASRLGIASRVRFHGWLPPDPAREILARAQIGLIPHVVCEAWHRTIPNKLFDYMARGIPVLSTATRPVVRIVEAEDCGRIFTDPSSFAQALAELADPGLRQQLGERGRTAVEREYHWARDEQKLLGVVRSLAG